MEILTFKETNQIDISYDENDRKVLNGYVFHSTIGKGSYSKVKLATKDGIKYAIKVINKNILERKKKGFGKDSEGNLIVNTLLQDALREISILKLISHKNIIKLYEIINFEQANKTYLVMEYASKGSIIDFNDKTGKFKINNNLTNKEIYSEDIIRGFIDDIAGGLEYLHSQNIIHRDIKTDNILINEDGICKITDFSVSNKLDGEDKLTKTEGNLYFYPPECCQGKTDFFAGKPVDIWALGVTIYVITFQKLPFMPKNISNLLELFELISKAEIVFPKERNISPELKDLLLKILDKNPCSRIKAGEIRKHPFITNFK